MTPARGGGLGTGGGVRRRLLLSSFTSRRTCEDPSRPPGRVRRHVAETRRLVARTISPLPGIFGGGAVSALTCPRVRGPPEAHRSVAQDIVLAFGRSDPVHKLG